METLTRDIKHFGWTFINWTIRHLRYHTEVKSELKLRKCVVTITAIRLKNKLLTWRFYYGIFWEIGRVERGTNSLFHFRWDISAVMWERLYSSE